MLSRPTRPLERSLHIVPFSSRACGTRTAEVLLQPDQACKETAFHRPLEEMFPLGCESTVQRELFLSFPKRRKQDAVGPNSPFGKKPAR